MNPGHTSVHLILKVLNSAAVNPVIDVPVVFLCVLTAYSIDLLGCETNCAQALSALVT